MLALKFSSSTFLRSLRLVEKSRRNSWTSPETTFRASVGNFDDDPPLDPRNSGFVLQSGSLQFSTGFMKPAIEESFTKVTCRTCQGTQQVQCPCCKGRKVLAKGGYQKRNPVNIEHIVGSKWTAMERTFGWRHFRVGSKRRAATPPAAVTSPVASPAAAGEAFTASCSPKNINSSSSSSSSSRRSENAGVDEEWFLDPLSAKEAETKSIKQITGRGKGSGKGGVWFVEMVSTCDENVRFWVNARNLKDRGRWCMGWLQKSELSFSFSSTTIHGTISTDKESKPGGVECKRCKGHGFLPCDTCERRAAYLESEDGGAGFLDIIEV